MKKLRNLSEESKMIIMEITLLIYLLTTIAFYFINTTVFAILMTPIVLIMAFLFIGGLFFSDWDGV